MTDVILRTLCHPDANGRAPQRGDIAWEFKIPLEDGTILHLHMGRESRDALRSFVLREEMDDTADEAQEKLDDSIDRMDRAFDGAEWRE